MNTEPRQAIVRFLPSARQPSEVVVGDVWSEVLAELGSPPVMVNRTHFSPGARTCWHVHQHGQVLFVEDGLALVQEDGGPVESVPAGSVVICKPHVRHWHGAAPNSTMTQLAVTPSSEDGTYAIWERQVSDEEYGEWRYGA